MSKVTLAENIFWVGAVDWTAVVSWDNGREGNYWSDYHGQGTYVIDENNIDHYPLMQPVDISAASSPLTIIVIVVVVAVVILAVVFLVYRIRRKRTKGSLLSENTTM